MWDDVMVMSFIFSPFNCQYFKVYWTYKLNFWYKHKRAEIQGREINRELWRKNGYYVPVTLTFDPRSPNSIEVEILTIEWIKLKWHHHDVIPHLIFIKFYIQICKGHIKTAYQISDGSNIPELRNTVGKLTENYEEKRILSHCDLDLWP